MTKNDIPNHASLPKKAREHLENYWSLSRRLFKEANYPLASFFAITLIEEVGKVIILGYKDISGKLDRKSFKDHKSKYVYAVHETLKVNSRVTRIYGENESKFASWFRNGKLFKIRNAAIYLEISNGSVQVPKDAISKDDACLLVCIAGEIYGEIQGFYTNSGPEEWNRIINEVDEFRVKNAD